MGSPEAGRSFLDEFHEFIMFLKSLWGILTGISIFFPLSNTFFGLIPQPNEDYAMFFFSPENITVIATIVTLFIVLTTFGWRFSYQTKNRIRIIRIAGLTFITGILLLVLYLALFYTKFDLLVMPLEGMYGHAGWVLGALGSDIVMTTAYTAFFALTTRSFMMLGLIEFLDIR